MFTTTEKTLLYNISNIEVLIRDLKYQAVNDFLLHMFNRYSKAE